MERQLQLPSEPVSAAHAVRFAEEVGREAALPPETIDRLVLAMGEAITNAIHHGNGLDPSRTVVLAWSGNASGGWLDVVDEGPGIDLQRLRHATLPDDPTQTNGRGLFLMRTFADAVEVKGPRLRLWFAPRPEELV